MSVNSLVSGVLSTPGMSSTGLNAGAVDKNSPEKIRQAASQFESLLIGQILKTMHDGDGEGWLGTGEEDQTAGSAMDLADDYFARSMSARGGLGLAHMVASGLAKSANSSSSATPSSPASLPNQTPSPTGTPNTDR